jgi:ATP-binding cassette, subfamily B, bacterial
MRSFPFIKQLNAMDCGPACLQMVAKYYGKHYKVEKIRDIAGFNKQGVSLLGISEAAEKIGFRTRAIQITYANLVNEARLPCILHWNQNHFVVLAAVKRSFFKNTDSLLVADPAENIISYTKKELLDHWISKKADNEEIGTALLLDPAPEFYHLEGDKKTKLNWEKVFQYLRHSKWQITQVFMALIVTSLLSLIFPFLTQSIVDTGIYTQNLGFITIVLIAQLMLVFSRTIVEFIRSRVLMSISIVISISILSDFWIKLTKLPISHFTSHHTGDTMQRLGDNKQIENFLTGSALNTLFSLVNFVIYAFILIFYNSKLFLIFAGGSFLYFLWVKTFLSFRRKLNYETFSLAARENNATLELVQGMQELKLNNAEKLKRWEWENLQAGIFKLNLKSLNYNQLQQAGALLINQGKDVFITFLVAKFVIEGKLTFGAMLAIQYIIGQMSNPIEQFIGFVQNAQDAKISMERLNEIHSLRDEEDAGKTYLTNLPKSKSIVLSNLSFAYPGAGNEPVLEGINMTIPEGKVTAIVGISGSGKTTLIKLLLKFYDSYNGEIRIGDANFKFISPSFWRKHCGAVMQEGYLFNDTIARNIAVGDEVIDELMLINSCKTANILSFIESLPNSFHTKLGSEGIGLSQGQKQRLLIARAVYKMPEYLFFDEATNALDANNEKLIVENMQEIFKGRTVIVVAHRLSTVKNADKIIVLHEGKIAEEGAHEQLSLKKGRYYELVKNQLDLGK